MARVKLDPMFLSISGTLGDVVFRHHADGSVSMCKKSLPAPGFVPSPAQVETRARFKAAAAQCYVLKQDPDKLAAYRLLTEKRGPLSRVRATMIADILQPPTISALDLSEYHGNAGDTIWVTAEESVAIARLSLTIRDVDTDKTIETAEQISEVDLLATSMALAYTTKVTVPAGHRVEVIATASDLAGNQVESRQMALE